MHKICIHRAPINRYKRGDEKMISFLFRDATKGRTNQIFWRESARSTEKTTETQARKQVQSPAPTSKFALTRKRETENTSDRATLDKRKMGKGKITKEGAALFFQGRCGRDPTSALSMARALAAGRGFCVSRAGRPQQEPNSPILFF